MTTGAVRSKWRYLRVARFDISSEAGRSAERYRVAAWGAVGNVVARVSTMATLVFAIHWTSPILGTERFGLWAMFLAMAATMAFLDFGVGNALINLVAHAQARQDGHAVRRTITAGVGWLTVVSVLSAALLVLIAALLPWSRVFDLSTPQIADEARTAGITFGLLFGLHTLASGVLKVLVGQQRSLEAHMATAVGAWLALGALWWVTGPAVTVAQLLVCSFGVNTLGGLFMLGVLACRGHIALGRIGREMRECRGAMLRTGSLFLLLQVGTTVGWGFDAVLLGASSGAAAVAAFAVTQRLFQFATVPVGTLNAPLWAAYADAMAIGDHAFVRRTFRRSMKASLGLGVMLVAGLAAAAPFALPAWTQSSIEVPMVLIYAAATWALLEIWGIVFGTYLNGVGIVREQVLTVLAFCAVALPAKVLAAGAFGATGMMLATIGSYLVTVLLIYTTVLRRRVMQPMRGDAP